MRTAHIKSIFCTILALAVLISGFVFVPENAQTAVAAGGYYSWSGYSSYLKGAGSPTNPFLISSPSDLAYFRKQVADSSGKITYYDNNNTSNNAKTKTANTAYYKLTCDIYYNDPNGDEWKSWSDTVKPTNGGDGAHTWTPAGYNDLANRNFEGSFDGAGYTIYGMYIVHTSVNGVGFIGALRYGVIKNLTLANGYVHGNNQVGAFIGQGRVGAELVNCTSNMRVVGSNAVGGLVGGNAKDGTLIATDVVLTTEGTIPSLTFYNCVNNSTVDGTKWVGGVMGYISAGASRVQIEECVNNGAVTTSSACVGGILGGTRQVDGYGHNLIQSCVNYGAITCNSADFTGGIVGCGRAIDIYSCQNYGTITSKRNNVGGISGGSNSIDNLANGRIYYCYNAGVVTGTYYTGGIVGGTKSVSVYQCANVGNVTGTYAVGGIVGRSSGTVDYGGSNDIRDTQVYDCYNAGTIVSTTNDATTGGIIGNAAFSGTTTDNKFTQIKRCFNVGTVTGGRAIAGTLTTVLNDEGTGIYFLTKYNDTCFGLSDVNTDFQGGTAVDSMISDAVLAKLGNNWEASYPFPTLKNIDYSLQNFGGRADMLYTASVSVNDVPELIVSVNVNTEQLYADISSKALTYGVFAAKTDSFTGELKYNTAGVINSIGVVNANSYSITINGQSVDEYDDMFTIRPYVSFVENGQTVYIYGDAMESSYYTADGAQNVPAVNETVNFNCDEKLYVLVGGSGEIECTMASASDKDSISFFSSDSSVATVDKGIVKGIKAGTATVTVTYTGAWGAVTRYCAITVLEDIAENIYANQYADLTGDMRIHTNKMSRALSITKNDATVIDCDGTVFVVDGGNNNDELLKYLLKLRDEFLAEGFASGALTEAEYYRLLLSDKCQIRIVALITHWHSDHIGGLRYQVSASPKVSLYKMYTSADPSNTEADGYTSILNAFDDMVARFQANNPNFTPTQFAFDTQKFRYFSSNNKLSTTDTSYPIKLSILTAKDWSTHSTLKTDSTDWVNCSSTWFIIEYAGKKMLFTGDTYNIDTGTTYTGATTSGTTPVDYMLYKHKTIVDTSVDWMDCNHHGRIAYCENLFTATQPTMVLAGLHYGLESALCTNKVVTTADLYLSGDQEQVFILGSDGVFDTSGAVVGYDMNAKGHAIRNHFTLKQTHGYGENAETVSLKSPDGVALPASQLDVTIGDTYWFAPTVIGDEFTDKNVTWEISDTSIITTDGAYITANKVGTAVVTVKAGDCSTSCTVNVVYENEDINCDGQISTSDCVMVKLHLVGASCMDADTLKRADLNKDGYVSGSDFMVIMSKLTELYAH